MKLTPHELAKLNRRPDYMTKHGPVSVDRLINDYAAGCSINHLSWVNQIPENRVRILLVENKITIRNKSQAALKRLQN